MTFAALAAELFADYGADFDFERLNAIDKRRLCAAYVRECADSASYLLEAIRPEAVNGALATLIEHPSRDGALTHCDVFDLAREFYDGIYPNESLLADVEGELARRWRMYRQEERPAMAMRQAV